MYRQHDPTLLKEPPRSLAQAPRASWWRRYWVANRPRFFIRSGVPVMKDFTYIMVPSPVRRWEERAERRAREAADWASVTSAADRGRKAQQVEWTRKRRERALREKYLFEEAITPPQPRPLPRDLCEGEVTKSQFVKASDGRYYLELVGELKKLTRD